MASKVGPTRERVDLLDALRGFALLGILLVNIVDWSGWGSLQEPQRIALAGETVTRWYQWLLRALLEGKFYTIFSFLFGLGFALQLSRLENRGAPGVEIYRRRLLVLLAFGLIHLIFVWDGDILTLYALLGLLLPFVRDWSDRRLITVAGALILLPIPGYALVHVAGIDPDLRLKDFSDWAFVQLGGDLEQVPIWRARDGWSAFFAWTVSGSAYRIGGLIDSWRLPKVMAIMMLGVWAGRRLIAGQLFANRTLLLRVALIGFAVGLPANIGYAYVGGLDQKDFAKGLAATALYAVGVVPLGLAYAASFALLWRRAEKVLSIFAAPGRMALTNYLSHTLICITIFYGVGFGLFAKLAPPAFCAVALAIFAAQVVGSRLWLRHFPQGPLEALWRRLTYGRRPAGTPLAAA